MDTPIRSPRLDLVLFSPELMDALIAGDRARAQGLAGFVFPDHFPGDGAVTEPHVVPPLRLLKMRRGQIAADPAWAPWLLRAMVLRAERAMVGYTNFHGPPGVNDTGDEGAAEIGYTVFPEHRGRGFATEAARAMMDWARREHGVTRFVSGIAPDNAPSIRVIEKLGFARTELVIDGEVMFEAHIA